MAALLIGLAGLAASVYTGNGWYFAGMLIFLGLQTAIVLLVFNRQQRLMREMVEDRGANKEAMPRRPGGYL